MPNKLIISLILLTQHLAFSLNTEKCNLENEKNLSLEEKFGGR